MKKILYRIWHKHNQKMEEPANWIDLWFEDSYLGDITDEEGFSKENFVFLECFNGKDKNGKLIFEGDIVRYRDTDNLRNEVCFVAHKGYAGVWDILTDTFQYYYENAYEKDKYKAPSRFEVLGNVFENKDMIDKKSSNYQLFGTHKKVPTRYL